MVNHAIEWLRATLSRGITRSVIVAIVGIILMLLAFHLLDWTHWVKTAFGVHAKLTLGAFHGLLWSRYVAKIDPSDHPIDERWKPGLAVCIYVCVFALAAAVGA